MNIKESHKHYAIGFIAAFVLMILVRLIVSAQDGGIKSDASMGGPNTFYCVNPDNPSETCIEPSAWHQFVYYTFGIQTQTTFTSVRILPDGPGDGGNNNPYTPNP